MILGMPVLDQHELTREAVASIARTVDAATLGDPAFQLVVVDNGSEVPYRRDEFGAVPFPLSVWRSATNLGYYRPLASLAARWKVPVDGLLGLVHNDVLFYEPGWNRRMERAFAEDPKLGLVGLCGSYEADDRGGRGAGTMCFFRGERGQSQAAGLRIYDLRPAVLLDSLFMLFRPGAIPLLDVDDAPPAHFYDKIWPCRLIEAGWRVAVLGSEIDHLGGMTAVANPRWLGAAREWCEARGIPPAGPDGRDWGLAVYLEAERRFLKEFRDDKRFVPCRIDVHYALHHANR